MPAKKNPIKYFLLVFALSTPIWVIEWFVNVNGLPLDIPITDIVAAFIPLIVACILLYKEEGGSAVKQLLKRIFDFSRIKKKSWYMPIIFLPFIIFAVIYLAIKISGLPFPNEWKISFISIPFLFVFFFLGAIGEEVGYMGYAVDPIQEKFSAFKTSLIIGIPWAIWHYPSIIKQGHGPEWILWGTLGTIGIRVLIIWLYNNTGKSLFACILFHSLYNLGRPLFPRDNANNPLVDYPNIHYSIIALTALFVIVFWGARTFTRHK